MEQYTVLSRKNAIFIIFLYDRKTGTLPMPSYPISLVVPTYNRLQLLGRALESVAKQTVKCSEIIVVDDGSTDGTFKFLNRLSATFKIPLIVIQQQNKGPAAARNCGIKHVKNEYIAFLDSDDHWSRKKIETQFRALKENPDFFISHTKE